MSENKTTQPEGIGYAGTAEEKARFEGWIAAHDAAKDARIAELEAKVAEYESEPGLVAVPREALAVVLDQSNYPMTHLEEYARSRLADAFSGGSSERPK